MVAIRDIGRTCVDLEEDGAFPGARRAVYCRNKRWTHSVVTLGRVSRRSLSPLTPSLSALPAYPQTRSSVPSPFQTTNGAAGRLDGLSSQGPLPLTRPETPFLNLTW